VLESRAESGELPVCPQVPRWYQGIVSSFFQDRNGDVSTGRMAGTRGPCVLQNLSFLQRLLNNGGDQTPSMGLALAKPVDHVAVPDTDVRGH
jgi:hypothetical protein